MDEASALTRGVTWGGRRRLLRRALLTLRYEGVPALLWRSLRRALSPIGYLRLVTFLEKDLTGADLSMRTVPGIKITPARPEDCDQIVELLERAWGHGRSGSAVRRAHYRDWVKGMMDRGNVCFVARAGDRIVHVNWVAFDWMNWPFGPALRAHLGPDEANTDNAYTDEDWRGRGIHGAVLGAMLRYIRDQGRHRAYAQAYTDNPLAMKPHLASGWRRTGVLAYFRPRHGDWVVGWRLWGEASPYRLSGRRLPFVVRGSSQPRGADPAQRPASSTRP